MTTMRMPMSDRHVMPAAPKPFYRMLYVQVLIGLALGIAIGYVWPSFGAALKPFGDGFVKLVKMMIAPIVFCTIVAGVRLPKTAGIVLVHAFAAI
jgi:Na+/H+-dicarboxylate symporter